MNERRTAVGTRPWSGRFKPRVVLLGLLSPVFLGRTARADLIGTPVTGSLTFAGFGATNYFAPANGYLPAAGYENSTMGTTVPISASRVEFGFQNAGDNRDTADFGSATLTISDPVFSSGTDRPFTLTFTDPAFQGLQVIKTADSFGSAGFTYAFGGSTLTINAPTVPVTSGTFEIAAFTLTPAGATVTPLPKPAAAGLSLLGLLGMAKLVRRRRPLRA